MPGFQCTKFISQCYPDRGWRRAAFCICFHNKTCKSSKINIVTKHSSLKLYSMLLQKHTAKKNSALLYSSGFELHLEHKYFIDQAFLVKMTGYWPRYFFACLYEHKHAKKKELGQYPGILTLCLVNNPYLNFTCA